MTDPDPATVVSASNAVPTAMLDARLRWALDRGARLALVKGRVQLR